MDDTVLEDGPSFTASFVRFECAISCNVDPVNIDSFPLPYGKSVAEVVMAAADAKHGRIGECECECSSPSSCPEDSGAGELSLLALALLAMGTEAWLYSANPH